MCRAPVLVRIALDRNVAIWTDIFVMILGAGSGEFHVYKQSRRREYERLKIMEETAKKVCTMWKPTLTHVTYASVQEQDAAEFEQRKREREEQSNAKTAKNRAKRQKKKNRAMGKEAQGSTDGAGTSEDPTKWRRLAADGANIVFRRPGDVSDEDDDEGPALPIPRPSSLDESDLPILPPDVKIAEPTQIIIHDD